MLQTVRKPGITRPNVVWAPVLILLAVACFVAFAPATSAADTRLTSRTLEGTFRVAKRGDAWTFVDPKGRKFFSLGLNVINPAEDAEVNPPKYDGLTRHGGDSEKWRAFALARLDAWHFNTVGAWSSLRGKPYVLELSLSYSWIDVFGDEFEAYVRKAALNSQKRADIAADFGTMAKDPLLIGYFTDNELDWDGLWLEWSQRRSVSGSNTTPR